MARQLTRTDIKRLARELGFSQCRFTDASISPEHGAALEAFVIEGRHGTMDWMRETFARRKHPRAMWPEAQSAIVLAMNYGPSVDPMQTLARKDKATISVYARNRDYHDVMKGRLKQIAQKIASRTSRQVKVFVDTAPLMEKPLAHQAGLGWQGKHTNLVSRELGSWFFIGTILTEARFDPDEPEIDHCGSCRACLDICPTAAFPKPYELDARRCISYITIEHPGHVDPELRPMMGNRIYGCDDCLAVCPWNKFASAASEIKLKAREELQEPDLSRLATLDEAGFRAFFSGSPIKRIGRNRFIRNVLIAIGNSGDSKFVASILPHLDDADAVVRSAAVWALARCADPAEFETQRDKRKHGESDQTVIDEWRAERHMDD